MGDSLGEVLGGPQSPKALLDAVIKAAIAGDRAELEDKRAEFTSVKENLAKCVDANGNTIVHLAVRKDPATLKYIVEEYGADIDAVNNHGKTALHIAVMQNYVACAEYLLNAGAKDNIPCYTLSTPFQTAASCGSVECLELLLNRLPEDKRLERINEADRNKCTALHKCAHDGGLRVTKWLLEKGADIEACDLHDSTPLLFAVKAERVDVVEALIAAGANIKHIDDKTNSAIHYAASKCLPRIFSLLLDKGAAIDEQNADGNSPLHLLCQHPHPDVPGWEEMGYTIIRRALIGNECKLLDSKNVAQRRAVDYLPLELKHLFTVARVKERDAQLEKQEATQADRAKKAQDKRQQLIAEKRAKLEEQERLQREEQDRLQREAEERHLIESDARTLMDEEAEARRLEEEEAKKKKKEKAGKGKK